MHLHYNQSLFQKSKKELFILFFKNNFPKTEHKTQTRAKFALKKIIFSSKISSNSSNLKTDFKNYIINATIPVRRHKVMTLPVAIIIAILTILFLLFLIPTVLLYLTMRRADPIDLTQSDKLCHTRFAPYTEKLSKGISHLTSLQWEDIWCKSFDGLSLHAFYMPGKGENAVILLHGYLSSPFNDFCGIADYYMQNRYSVFMVDQRAHGKSGGSLSTFGVRESRDVASWVLEAGRLCPGKIVLHGMSMGGNAALTSLKYVSRESVCAVIADSAFDNAKEILAYSLTRQYKLPQFPFVFLGTIGGYILVNRDFVKSRASDAVEGSGVPVLIICGEQDHTSPVYMTDRILCASGDLGKRVIFENSRHCVSYLENSELYLDTISDFLEKNV